MTIKFNANKSLIHESNVRAIAYSLPTRGNFLSCTSSSLLQSMDITYLCSRIVTLGIGKRGYFFLRCSLVRGQALCSVVRALYFRLIGGIYNVLLWHYLTEPLNKPRNLCHDKTTINFILDWNTFFVRAHGLGRTQINQIHQIDLSLSWSMLPISPTVGEQVSTRYSIPYGWLFLGPLQIVQSFRHLMLPFVDFPSSFCQPSSPAPRCLLTIPGDTEAGTNGVFVLLHAIEDRFPRIYPRYSHHIRKFRRNGSSLLGQEAFPCCKALLELRHYSGWSWINEIPTSILGNLARLTILLMAWMTQCRGFVRIKGNRQNSHWTREPNEAVQKPIIISAVRWYQRARRPVFLNSSCSDGYNHSRMVLVHLTSLIIWHS